MKAPTSQPYYQRKMAATCPRRERGLGLRKQFHGLRQWPRKPSWFPTMRNEVSTKLRPKILLKTAMSLRQSLNWIIRLTNHLGDFYNHGWLPTKAKGQLAVPRQRNHHPESPVGASRPWRGDFCTFLTLPAKRWSLAKPSRISRFKAMTLQARTRSRAEEASWFCRARRPRRLVREDSCRLANWPASRTRLTGQA